MKLSTRSRYGLRAMMAIARHSDDPVTSERLSREEAVSKKYLDSILARLRRAGLLEAATGLHGGYRLARRADEINAAEIVEALEGDIALTSCVSVDDPNCARAGTCVSREVWREVTRAVRETLEQLSLAELANRSGAPVK